MKNNIIIDQLCAQIQDNINVTQKLLEESLDIIWNLGNKITMAIKKGHKLLLCGNGGSAADSQHIAAEFVNRFKKDRLPLPAIALTTDTSIITSIANDYGYKYTFSKQVLALGQKGDIIIGISTSGMAENVIEAVKTARAKGLYTIGLTGAGGGRLKDIVNLCIKVPSHDTPRIQETHILIGHLVCDIVEKAIFG